MSKDTISPQGYKELRDYVEGALARANVIRAKAGNSKNTLKIRCCNAIMAICIARIQAARILLQNSTGDDFAGAFYVADLFVHKALYEPILEYWEKVLGLREDNGE